MQSKAEGSLNSKSIHDLCLLQSNQNQRDEHQLSHDARHGGEQRTGQKRAEREGRAGETCGAAAPKEMYVKLIEYAKKYNFYIVNDNAYSDIIFDGREGYSFLSIPGAKEVGIEFFSLSKSFDTTGARISFAIGNKKIIDAIKTIRSQYDFGMFLPIQYGAIAALTGETESVKAQCAEYQRRRDALCGGFRKIGWNVPDSEGTMFVWAPIPKNFVSSEEFWEALIDKTGILCTPGNAFGPAGEGK